MLRTNGRKVLVLSEAYESVPVVLPGWFEEAKEDELEALRIGIEALLNPPGYFSLLTISEAAAEIGWDQGRIKLAIAGTLGREYSAVGPLPSVRLGSRVLIKRSELEAWLDRLLEHEAKGR